MTTTTARRNGPRWISVARALTCSVTLASAVFVGGISVARGEAGRAALHLGQSLRELSPYLGERNEVRLNGERIVVGARHVEDDVAHTLDAFQDNCRGFGLDLSAQGDRLPSAMVRRVSSAAPSLSTLRKEVDGEGAITCLVSPSGPRTLESFARDAAEFLQTGNLGSLGQLRYAHVRKASTGSTVISVYNETGLNLSHMFPKNGDAPGDDWPEVPRFQGSQRILSADVGGTSYGVRMYRTQQSPTEVQDWYRAELSRHGWNTSDAMSNSQSSSGSEARCIGFWQHGASALVCTGTGDGQTLINLVQMGTRGEALF